MSIYFDHAATTQTCSEAIEAMVEAAGQTYGNPSSLHGKGMAAEDRIVDARKFFAKTLGVTEKEIFSPPEGQRATTWRFRVWQEPTEEQACMSLPLRLNILRWEVSLPASKKKGFV